jgi:hypothetical protein
MPGSPYGRGPYGKGHYAFPSGSGRPYGFGKYGTGHYSRWGANVYDAQARVAVVFTATAPLPHVTWQPLAASSVTFEVRANGVQIELPAAGVSGIVFSAQASLAWTWDALRPCETGTWTMASACAPGAWTPLAGCAAGAWTVTR